MKRKRRVNRCLFMNSSMGLFGVDMSHREIFYFMGMVFGDLDRAIAARAIGFFDDSYLEEARGCLPERFGGRLDETPELSKWFKRYERVVRRIFGPNGIAEIRSRLISAGIIVDSDDEHHRGKP